MKATIIILLAVSLLLAGCKSDWNPAIIPVPDSCKALGPVYINGTKCVVLFYGQQATSIDCDWWGASG